MGTVTAPRRSATRGTNAGGRVRLTTIRGTAAGAAKRRRVAGAQHQVRGRAGPPPRPSGSPSMARATWTAQSSDAPSTRGCRPAGRRSTPVPAVGLERHRLVGLLGPDPVVREPLGQPLHQQRVGALVALGPQGLARLERALQLQQHGPASSASSAAARCSSLNTASSTRPDSTSRTSRRPDLGAPQSARRCGGRRPARPACVPVRDGGPRWLRCCAAMTPRPPWPSTSSSSFWTPPSPGDPSPTWSRRSPTPPSGCGSRSASTNGRPGGTVSGPSLMALADCAAWLVIVGQIGPVALP